MIRNDFAAFVITYRRFDVLKVTIEAIFSQSVAPSKVLIIDNGNEPLLGMGLEKEFRNVEYFNSGSNLGPAGGAAIGLQRLASEGYSWIFWGDDDDPPKGENWFERLLNLGDQMNDRCGQVGVVGQRFSSVRGEIVRVTDNELLTTEENYICVDTIAGGMCKIVHRNVVLAGCLPKPELFFGFEELHFDLCVKEKGFRSYVDRDLFFNARSSSGRLGYRRSAKDLGRKENLVRMYYSQRNLIYILKVNRYFFPLGILMIKLFLKCVLSLQNGLFYSVRFSYLALSAVSDGLRSKLGLRSFGEVGKA